MRGFVPLLVILTFSAGLTPLAQVSHPINVHERATRNDFAYAIVVDSAGNIIIAGATESYGAVFEDVFIAKYSPSKVLLWNVTWGGGGRDKGYGVAVDSTDNIVVTGATDSFGSSGANAFILKFSSSGEKLWNITWGGANYDCGYGVSVDSANSIIITGYTNSSGAGLQDVFIAKYSSSGSQLWSNTWGASYNDRGCNVDVDSLDNIVVTGCTDDSGTSAYNAIIVKYTSSGEYEWNLTIGGENDFGQDVTVDTVDNILITGYKYASETSSWDVFLAKSHSSGALLWDREWGGAYDDQGYGVALDSSGNILIAGTTESFGVGSADVFVVNYSASGILLWNTTWGGSQSDHGCDATVDATNHALVAGYTDSFSPAPGLSDAFILHVSADPLLQTTWGGATLDNGQSVAVDSANNMILTGFTDSFGAGNNDAFIAKYSSSGSLLWNETWGGSLDDRGYGIAVDSTNNIVIAGYTRSFSADLYDAFVAEYSPSGTQLWNRTWGGTSYDYGYDVAVDSTDNVIITGSTRSFGVGRFDDIFVVKYSPAGEKLWNTTWKGNGYDYGYGCVVDSADNIIIAGKTSSFGGGFNALVVKYSPSGEQLWNATWGANSFSNDVAVDSSDSIIITGQTSSLGGGSTEAFVVQFSPLGDPQWSAIWGGSQNDQGWSVVVDGADNIVMSGETYRSTLDGIDAFVVKYSPLGVELWNHKWGGSNSDYGYAAAVDSANNVILAGATASLGAGSTDAFIAKYPSSGFQFWQILSEHHHITGDVDGDGDVDFDDLLIFSEAYGNGSSELSPNQNCDFNNDNKIDVSDLSILGKNYSKTIYQ